MKSIKMHCEKNNKIYKFTFKNKQSQIKQCIVKYRHSLVFFVKVSFILPWDIVNNEYVFSVKLGKPACSCQACGHCVLRFHAHMSGAIYESNLIAASACRLAIQGCNQICIY